MNQGKIFENDFQESVPDDVYCQKLQDAAIGFNIEESKQRFAPKSPYDYFLYRKPNMWCLELKSTQGTSMSFAGKTPMIKKHQREELMKAYKKGCIAGLVLNFRKYPLTYYIPIRLFEEFVESTDKKSINVKDIWNMIDNSEESPILIGQELKQVHYRYLVDSFLKETSY